MSFYAIYASCNFNRSIYIERNVEMMTKEGSTQIVNFMTSGAGVLELGCGHISHSKKGIISLKIFFSTTMHRLDKRSI